MVLLQDYISELLSPIVIVTYLAALQVEWDFYVQSAISSFLPARDSVRA